MAGVVVPLLGAVGWDEPVGSWEGGDEGDSDEDVEDFDDVVSDFVGVLSVASSVSVLVEVKSVVTVDEGEVDLGLVVVKLVVKVLV